MEESQCEANEIAQGDVCYWALRDKVLFVTHRSGSFVYCESPHSSSEYNMRCSELTKLHPLTSANGLNGSRVVALSDIHNNETGIMLEKGDRCTVEREWMGTHVIKLYEYGGNWLCSKFALIPVAGRVRDKKHPAIHIDEKLGMVWRECPNPDREGIWIDQRDSTAWRVTWTGETFMAVQVNSHDVILADGWSADDNWSMPETWKQLEPAPRGSTGGDIMHRHGPRNIAKMRWIKTPVDTDQ